VAQQRSHVVHLAMAGAGIAARQINFFHDYRGFRQAKARATVFRRNERGQPAGLCERIDKFFRVAARFIHFLPIRRIELAAQIAQRFAQLLVLIG
jgi:hypothetical protein